MSTVCTSSAFGRLIESVAGETVASFFLGYSFDARLSSSSSKEAACICVCVVM